MVKTNLTGEPAGLEKAAQGAILGETPDPFAESNEFFLSRV